MGAKSVKPANQCLATDVGGRSGKSLPAGHWTAGEQAIQNSYCGPQCGAPHRQDDDLRSELCSSRESVAAAAAAIWDVDRCCKSANASAVFVVLFDFFGFGVDQLTLRKGDQVRVLNCHESGDWCRVELIRLSSGDNGAPNQTASLSGGRTPGNVGWVPSVYLSLKNDLRQYAWYHGKISRGDAELLLSSGINGSFLVRESESCPGQISVSLRYEGRVYHYRLNEDCDGKLFITADRRFSSLAHLVQFHSHDADGLACALLYAAPKKDVLSSASLFVYPSDNWEVDRTEVVMKHRLGGGQYGDVYEAYWRRMNRPVAVKTLKEDSMAVNEFLSEATIMKDLCHKNLVQLLGICSQEPPYYIILEFMVNGNLLEYLRNSPREELGQAVLLYIASQICSGMAYLESKSYIHRDLAARNCLVGDSYVVKIADFGLARHLKDDKYTAKVGAKFPIKWTAPEGLAYNTFSTKSDVWAYGVLLWEIATHGKAPYPGVEFSEVYTLLEKGFRMECPDECPSAAYQLMLQCWRWNPSERPTFRSICSILDELNSSELRQTELARHVRQIRIGGGQAQSPSPASEHRVLRSFRRDLSGSASPNRTSSLEGPLNDELVPSAQWRPTMSPSNSPSTSSFAATGWKRSAKDRCGLRGSKPEIGCPLQPQNAESDLAWRRQSDTRELLASKTTSHSDSLPKSSRGGQCISERQQNGAKTVSIGAVSSFSEQPDASVGLDETIADDSSSSLSSSIFSNDGAVPTPLFGSCAVQTDLAQTSVDRKHLSTVGEPPPPPKPLRRTDKLVGNRPPAFGRSKSSFSIKTFSSAFNRTKLPSSRGVKALHRNHSSNLDVNVLGDRGVRVEEACQTDDLTTGWQRSESFIHRPAVASCSSSRPADRQPIKLDGSTNSGSNSDLLTTELHNAIRSLRHVSSSAVGEDSKNESGSSALARSQVVERARIRQLNRSAACHGSLEDAISGEKKLLQYKSTANRQKDHSLERSCSCYRDSLFAKPYSNGGHRRSYAEGSTGQMGKSESASPSSSSSFLFKFPKAIIRPVAPPRQSCIVVAESKNTAAANGKEKNESSSPVYQPHTTEAVASGGYDSRTARERIVRCSKTVDNQVAKIRDQPNGHSAANYMQLSDTLHQLKLLCSAYAERSSARGKFRFREVTTAVESHISFLKSTLCTQQPDRADRTLSDVEASVRTVVALLKADRCSAETS